MLLPRVTLEPPAGAVWVRVTVQVLIALWPSRLGCIPEWRPARGPQELIAAVWELVPRVAVTVAL